MAEPAAHAPYRRDRATGVTFLVLVGLGLLHACMGTVLPYLRRDLDVGYAAMGLHLTAFAIGSLTAGLAAPAAQRAVGRTAVVIGAACGAVAATALLVAGDTLALTIPASGLQGVALAAGFIGVWSLLSDHHGDGRAVALSEGEMAVSVGNLSLPLLVGAAASAGLGWRAGLLAACGALLAAAGVLSRTPVPVASAASAAAGRGALRGLGPLLVLVVCIVGFESGILTWLASYLDDEVELARDVAVTATSVVFVAMLAGRLLASRLARRLRPRALLTAALLTVLAGVPVLVVAGAPAPALAAIVVLGVGMGALFPLASSLVMGAAGAASTRASSAAMVAASAGVLIVPAAMGQLAGLTNLRVAVASAAALPLVAVAILRLPRGGTAERPG